MIVTDRTNKKRFAFCTPQTVHRFLAKEKFHQFFFSAPKFIFITIDCWELEFQSGGNWNSELIE